jgi:hypothetical protein
MKTRNSVPNCSELFRFDVVNLSVLQDGIVPRRKADEGAGRQITLRLKADIWFLRKSLAIPLVDADQLLVDGAGSAAGFLPASLMRFSSCSLSRKGTPLVIHDGAGSPFK